MTTKRCLVYGLALSLVLFVGVKVAVTCCGQLVDIWSFSVSPDILDPCAGDTATISGQVYEYYWAGSLNTWPMGVTITVTDYTANVVKVITATVTTDYMGQSDGVDDDGDGLIDEDSGFPTVGVDDDGDGRIDEDGEFPAMSTPTSPSRVSGTPPIHSVTWCLPAPMHLTITAQAGDMGSATVFSRVVTITEEPCCVEDGTVRITPRTISKDRMGRWITAHVMPPDGYVPADVIGARIVSIDGMPVSIDGLMRGPSAEGAVAKFSSEDVIGYLPDVPEGPSGHTKPGRIQEVEICVEVDLSDGEVSCYWCDVVDVIEE